MSVEELSAGAANTAVGMSANRTPETAIFGMETRTIRLPLRAATPDALDNSLELALTKQDRFASLTALVQRDP